MLRDRPLDGIGSAVAGEPPALVILFASESGNSERLAADAASAAGGLGLEPKVVDMFDATLDVLADAGALAVIASTYGEGEPPERANAFHAALESAATPLPLRLRYAVLALGDRASADFCRFGKEVDRRLADLGATRAADLVECDFDYAAPAAAWIAATLAAFAKDLGAAQRVSMESRFSPPVSVADMPGPRPATIVRIVGLHSTARGPRPSS